MPSDFTPESLERIAFNVVLLGYDESAVDDFIEEVIGNLRAGRPAMEGLTAGFSSAIRGYDKSQVDAMVRQLAAGPPEPNTGRQPKPKPTPPSGPNGMERPSERPDSGSTRPPHEAPSAVVERKRRGWFRR